MKNLSIGNLHFFSFTMSSDPSKGHRAESSKPVRIKSSHTSRVQTAASSSSNSLSKLSTHFQLIDKMNISSSVRALSSEDMQQVKHATNKIHNHLISNDKASRDQIAKNSFYIQSLLAATDTCKDEEVLRNIMNIFSEIIGRTNTGARCSQLVSQGLTQVCFQVLVRESRQDPPDDFIIQLHYILSKLGLKDRKFGVKARLSQSLQVTLSFIRNRTNSASLRLLQPVLTVLKQYSGNAINASYLGKNGAISHLFKCLSNINKKNSVMSKTVLDTLVLLVKSKSNSARAVGFGGVPILLQMHADWHKIDSKNRHVALRKSILNVLKHITNLKSGRQAVIDADGVRVLYKTCEEIMDVRELENLIFVASLILRKCFPRQKLPAHTNKSTLLYKVPASDFHTPQGLSKDAAQLMGIKLDSEAAEDDDSSLDNDDDISSDDEPDNNKNTNEVYGYYGYDFLSLPAMRAEENRYSRTVEDLQMYEKYLPEVIDIETQEGSWNENPLPSLPQIKKVTSTGSIKSNLHSMPNLSMMLKEEGGLAGSANLRLIEGPRGGVSPKQSGSRPTHDAYERPETVSSPGVSAVNMKTGQAVFSLDIPLEVPVQKPNSSKSTRCKSAKLQKKTTPVPTPEIQPDPEPELSEDGSCSLFEETIDIEQYIDVSKATVSVGRFTKIAYPDLHGCKPNPNQEPLYDRKFGVQRAKIFEDIDRLINPDNLINKVVFDFDENIKQFNITGVSQMSCHDNDDESRLGKADLSVDHLCFNSHFECGNLRRVTQIRQREYDLTLCPDINTNHHHQWFYFEVSNMTADVSYRFNIINNEKVNSQFNYGMQPVMFSVQEAVNGSPYWTREGFDICYYKNHLARSSQVTGGLKGKLYYTTTFTIQFKHSNDVCYLAYHYPYTYTSLQYQLYQWDRHATDNTFYYKNQVLCSSVSGNDVNLLTITNYPQNNSREAIDQFRMKPYIFLSCRVHPGESNSSWVMKGTIEHLLNDSQEAQLLRDHFIFKIIPILNPDGVVNGNHRCSLTAEDLNRRYLLPCPKLHPSIYHTKGLLQLMKHLQRSPFVYCDYHGHSRRKNVFLYGCSPLQSWMNEDNENPAALSDKNEDTSYKFLPKILSQSAPAFSLSNCSFTIEKAKESTGRVVVWRQIGVVRSYTMESSYCGCDQGPYNGYHINVGHLAVMGRKFADALFKLKMKSRGSSELIAALDARCNTAFHSFEENTGACSAEGANSPVDGCKETEEEFVDDNLSDDSIDDPSCEDDNDNDDL